MAELTAVRLRPMTNADIPSALGVERATFPQPWTEAIFTDELSVPGRVYVVAEDDGRLVGYGGLMVVGDEAHITTLTVAPASRGGGIGSRLMLSLTEAAIGAGARSLTLEVRASNHGAQALYRRFGMAPVGVRKHYYRDEDAVIMWAHDLDQPEFAERLDALRAELS
jgi:ribosomal-protein-alanine N-acetyltransferase